MSTESVLVCIFFKNMFHMSAPWFCWNVGPSAVLYPLWWCCLILTLLTGKEMTLYLEFNGDAGGRHGWFMVARGPLLSFSSAILKTAPVLRESGDVAVISASSSNTTCWNRVNHHLHKCSPWKTFVFTVQNNISTSDLQHVSKEPLKSFHTCN